MISLCVVQWTHLQLISFAIAPVVLLIVHLLKRPSGGAIANESTVIVQRLHADILFWGSISRPEESIAGDRQDCNVNQKQKVGNEMAVDGFF